jgi:Flp pilus assembly protein TadG
MFGMRKSEAGSHRDGTVAIEYALIMPAMLMFTLGIMDMGRLLWTYTTLFQATEAAARCAAVDATNCATTTQIQNYAVDQAWGLTIAAAAFTVTNPTCGMQVDATYSFQFVIPWFFGTAPYGTANTLPLSATACDLKQY